LGPEFESESGVINFLTMESESHKNKDSTSLVRLVLAMEEMSGDKCWIP